ncbi:acetyltransferase (GNAT) family protein [Idiomarina sp. A28L]|uniref:GNAT family N-acetyltransferase n=1 Tax=Idiomarina sp. A28L TaxID=1036674 RepID=UPI0002138BC0|nr:GNAT family N-acetyltransferase [Idiomarina sp. A28L]EGN74575.1 acetyltransferase (GNAT) family protein [Idiomarina sp. A28L]
MKANRFLIEQYDVNKTYYQQKNFDCGNRVINKFVHSSLKKQVANGFSQAYVLLNSENNGRFSAFYTLSSFKLIASDMLSLSSGSFPRDIPCARLIMLGVENELQGQGIGKKLMADVFHRVHKAAKEIGIYGLYLDADLAAIDFYRTLGFVRLNEESESSTAKMFLSMREIHAAIE